jgi:hypothetical protein
MRSMTDEGRRDVLALSSSACHRAKCTNKSAFMAGDARDLKLASWINCTCAMAAW